MKRIVNGIISWIVAAAASITYIQPVSAESAYSFYCNFDNYSGGNISVELPDNSYPWSTDVVLNGRVSQYKAFQTEKDTSLWINVGDAENADQYMEGTVLSAPSTDKIVMQFDVMPLGLGSATAFSFKGKSTSNADVIINTFTVKPDGTVKIYARGTIVYGSDISEQCYTQTASVTLRKGAGTAYTDPEAITIPVDEWSNLAAVYDVAGKKLSYYINNELIFSNAIPFNWGNDLSATGVTSIRMQTGKYAGFSALTDEEKEKVGLYVDELEVYSGDVAIPEPEETDTPEPEETDTPEPKETDTPEPEETDIPKPDVTDTPKPVSTDVPDEGEKIENDTDFYISEDFEHYYGGTVTGLGGRFTNLLSAAQTEQGTALWMRASRKKMLEVGTATDNYFRPLLGDELADDLVFQADFKPIGGSNYTFISIMDSSSRLINGFRLYNNGDLMYFDGTDQNSLSTINGPNGGILSCEENKWINLAIVFKIKNKTIDIYADRQLVIKDSPMYTGNGMSAYSRLNIQQTIYDDTSDGALTFEEQGVYMDNIKIYKGSYLYDDIVYYRTDFNNMQAGKYVADDLSPDYIVNGACSIVSAGDTEGQSLKFDDADGFIQKDLKITQTGTIYIASSVNLLRSPNTDLFAFVDGEGNYITTLRIDEGKLFVFDGSTERTLCELDENKWYKVEVVYNLSTATATVKVDGTQQGEYAVGINAASSVVIKNNSGSILLDNIKMSEQSIVPKIVRTEYYSGNTVEENSNALTHRVNKIVVYFNTAMRESYIVDAARIASDSGDSIGYNAVYDRDTNSLCLELSDSLAYFENYTIQFNNVINKRGILLKGAKKLNFSTNAPFTAFEMELMQNGHKINTVSELVNGTPVTINLGIVSNSRDSFDCTLCAAMYKDNSMISIATRGCSYTYGSANKYSFEVDYATADEINIFVISSNEAPIPLYDSFVIGE